ncbi:hypothetical protein PAP_05835 [Palaeococcus pacificus DY20341]|uniref:Bifunctional IPC transferase and DIPP synthase n=1 Tax=Palaeococcus pacificus DY20341 TaxID=1343739 RepID=A0A075LUB4_9EURY|nr:bifunctional L-myo-inositol-1-phosphate cytidylyltransferase/CDP-L-myo-inositol myo-inositolphosphotransferase [Palaeococcus pacificus]AIF69567.1 hypothetical protein PAP_05835 [Palaeococcus pacificus DY20341]
MKGVILAAGLGSRMGRLTEETPKGLLRIAGREILYRTMKTLEELGVEEFIIVTNPKYEDKFREFLRENGFNAQIIVNEHPEKGNGYSLYLAKNYVGEKFILVMSDHVYERAFLERAIRGEGLIIDRNPKYVNLKEATKVLVEDGRIKDIGKRLKAYDGADTGFFVLTKETFKYAEGILEQRGKAELSEIVKKAGLKVTEVSGLFWMDVDTPQDLKKANRFIVLNAVKGTGDGFISRHLNRKISTRISALLANHITPMQATIFTFLLGLFAAVMTFLSIPLAGLLYQMSSILDGVDGEIARASMRTSRFGGYLDSILDRYVDFAFILMLALAYGKTSLGFWSWVALAIFGSVMVSYSTERYKAAYGKDIYKETPTMRYLPGKRDERIFLTMLFCLLGLIEWVFIVLAALTHLRVFTTVLLVRRNAKT